MKWLLEKSLIREVVHVFDQYICFSLCPPNTQERRAIPRQMPLKEMLLNVAIVLKLHLELGAYPLAVQPEENWYRDKCECNESQ